jgi:hypothetical protein
MPAWKNRRAAVAITVLFTFFVGALFVFRRPLMSRTRKGYARVMSGPQLWLPHRIPLQRPSKSLTMASARRRSKPTASDFDSMKLGRLAHRHRFLYIFEGNTVADGAPVTQANISVRVLTEDGTFSKSTETDAQGHYRIGVPLNSPDNDLIDYVLEATAPEFQNAVMVGRRITTFDDTRVVIEGLVALQTRPGSPRP